MNTFGLSFALGFLITSVSVAANSDADEITVADPSAATLLANEACEKGWSAEYREMGYRWTLDVKDWRARRDGDHWFAWTGDEKRPDMKINVPLRGAPDGATCAQRILDDQVPYVYPPPGRDGGWREFTPDKSSPKN